jgi:hypothetical protein
MKFVAGIMAAPDQFVASSHLGIQTKGVANLGTCVNEERRSWLLTFSSYTQLVDVSRWARRAVFHASPEALGNG